MIKRQIGRSCLMMLLLIFPLAICTVIEAQVFSGNPAANPQAPYTQTPPVYRNRTKTITIPQTNTGTTRSDPESSFRSLPGASDSSRIVYCGIMGEVARPGVYEFSAQFPELLELLNRSGGLTVQASNTFRVIRNSRPGQLLFFRAGMKFPLMQGDLIVVGSQLNSDRQSRVIDFTQAQNNQKPQARQQFTKQLAFLNLIDRPVVLKVRKEQATIPQLVGLLRQDPKLQLLVKVVSPATRTVMNNNGQPSYELVNQSVLIFPNQGVDQSVIPRLPASIPESLFRQQNSTTSQSPNLNQAASTPAVQVPNQPRQRIFVLNPETNQYTTKRRTGRPDLTAPLSANPQTDRNLQYPQPSQGTATPRGPQSPIPQTQSPQLQFQPQNTVPAESNPNSPVNPQVPAPKFQVPVPKPHHQPETIPPSSYPPGTFLPEETFTSKLPAGSDLSTGTTLPLLKGNSAVQPYPSHQVPSDANPPSNQNSLPHDSGNPVKMALNPTRTETDSPPVITTPPLNINIEQPTPQQSEFNTQSKLPANQKSTSDNSGNSTPSNELMKTLEATNSEEKSAEAKVPFYYDVTFWMVVIIGSVMVLLLLGFPQSLFKSEETVSAVQETGGLSLGNHEEQNHHVANPAEMQSRSKQDSHQTMAQLGRATAQQNVTVPQQSHPGRKPDSDMEATDMESTGQEMLPSLLESEKRVLSNSQSQDLKQSGSTLQSILPAETEEISSSSEQRVWVPPHEHSISHELSMSSMEERTNLSDSSFEKRDRRTQSRIERPATPTLHGTYESVDERFNEDPVLRRELEEQAGDSRAAEHQAQQASSELLDRLVQNRIPLMEETVQISDQVQFTGRPVSPNPTRVDAAEPLQGPHFQPRSEEEFHSFREIRRESESLTVGEEQSISSETSSSHKEMLSSQSSIPSSKPVSVKPQTRDPRLSLIDRALTNVHEEEQS